MANKISKVPQKNIKMPGWHFLSSLVNIFNGTFITTNINILDHTIITLQFCAHEPTVVPSWC